MSEYTLDPNFVRPPLPPYLVGVTSNTGSNPNVVVIKGSTISPTAEKIAFATKSSISFGFFILPNCSNEDRIGFLMKSNTSA